MLSKSVLKPHSFGGDVPGSSPTNSNLKNQSLWGNQNASLSVTSNSMFSLSRIYLRTLVHPPSPPSHRGRATRSVSSWSCWADQTLPSRWEAWWYRVPQNDSVAVCGDVQNAIFLHFAAAFRRSWCAWGRKVSVKLSSFGTKPSKFCLTVGKKRWDVMSLTAGDWYFSGSGMWCMWTFWCSADLPYGELMVSMHLNSCPANKSSTLIVCRGLTQEN